MEGAFAADGQEDQIVQEILARIDYEPEKGRESEISITSATVATDSTPFQCSDRAGSTVCERNDDPVSPDYCASEEDVCEVTPEGHEGCTRPEYELTGAHCNMGCCSELPPQVNTCNAEGSQQRECDPLIEPFFTATYMLWGERLMTYDVPIRCSDDGLWTLPCIVDGDRDMCPYGGICVPPDDEGWGRGLEEYGYCSCLEG